MKRFETYAAIAAVIFFFCWALAGQYQVERLQAKATKLKNQNQVLLVEKTTIKHSIELQNNAINALHDLTLATQSMLADEIKKAQEFKKQQDKKIDSIRREPSTNDCEQIRERMIKHALES